MREICAQNFIIRFYHVYGFKYSEESPKGEKLETKLYFYKIIIKV